MPARATVPAMNVPLRTPWSQQQFFSWAAAQEGRYEFDGFQPVDMTGGTAAHSIIMRNVHAALRAAPRQRTASLSVRTLASRQSAPPSAIQTPW